MNYLSLFSGIEAVSVAAKSLNWQAVAFSEIADFPCEVLKYHYPSIQNLGDVKNINGEKYNGTVDIIIGGSPCQNFSIAGNRKGLYGEHSSLAWEFIRILSEVQPKWFLWENVPGTLSTNNGEDFKQLLTELSKLGYGLAWRVLDAQYFGVPQRRRRIFLVGYFGDWRPPVAVLFERKSLSSNFAKSGKKEYCSARTVPDCHKKANGIGDIQIYDIQQRSDVLRKCNIIPTLTSRMGTGGNNIPLINNNKIIRKLTPFECERLQGFPDNYTDIPYKGKKHSPLYKRYEAIGNSMAVPVIEWILKRITIVDNCKNELSRIPR